jgi:hypothetical protein
MTRIVLFTISTLSLIAAPNAGSAAEAVLFTLSNSATADDAPVIIHQSPVADHQSLLANQQWSTLTPLQLQLNQYFYVDFARQLQALDNQSQLAEAELALIARRVESYRPFRSFHQYAATYTVDQQWQLALLAAQQRVQCLRNAQADLWRQRQMMASLYLAPTM